MTKVFTLEEVSQHSTAKDCWLVIGGKVYDVTSFLEEHPGGDDVLISATAKDATDDFEDVGHSKAAREMLTKYYVGDIDESTLSKTAAKKTSQQTAYNPDKQSDFIIKILQFAVPIGILGLALAVRYFTKVPA